MSRAARSPAEYYPALTGLRAAAALLVFYHHYYGHWYGGGWGGPSEYVREGYLGVSIFFTLSGFLIARTYYERFKSGSIRWFDYWIRRFARIYPVYLCILAVKSWIIPPASVWQFLANATITQAFFASYIFTGLTPSWTLTVEESFYLTAPWIFLAIAGATRFLDRADVLSSRSRIRGVLLLGAVTLLFWQMGAAAHAFKPGGNFLSSPTYIFTYNIFGRFGEFAIGIFAALYFARRERATPSPAARAWVAEGAFLLSVGAAALTLAVLVRLKHRHGVSYGIFAPDALFALWIGGLGTILFIWSAINGSRLATAIFGNPVVEYLGRVSYIFYLLQDGQLATSFQGWLERSTPFNPRSSLLVSYAALTLGAMILYHLVEKPAHALILGIRQKLPTGRLPGRSAGRKLATSRGSG